MADEIIFREENEKDFWKYWEEYIYENKVSPKYLKTFIEYLLLYYKPEKDRSFVYLQNNKVAGCVFFPIKEIECLAPIFDKGIEKKLFSSIDKIAMENGISKLMFCIDPLEKISYNYLQKYGYVDASIMAYLLDLNSNLLERCRENTRKMIRKLLKDKDFSVFYIDKDNPDYNIHKEYETLHHKCSGGITRPQETFDKQYEQLKQGQATLFGLKYKGKNVAYSYFMYNADKVVYTSAADDPDYDEIPLYHLLIFSAMKHFQEKGMNFIDVGQPLSSSKQFLYYPDKKQLNISLFKRSFAGNYANYFRGVKYFSKEVFEKDIKNFLLNYGKTI